jgi:hypothetical protein
LGVNPDEEQRVQDAAARVECREFTAGVGLKRKENQEKIYKKPGENLQKKPDGNQSKVINKFYFF